MGVEVRSRPLRFRVGGGAHLPPFSYAYVFQPPMNSNFRKRDSRGESSRAGGFVECQARFVGVYNCWCRGLKCRIEARVVTWVESGTLAIAGGFSWTCCRTRLERERLPGRGGHLISFFGREILVTDLGMRNIVWTWMFFRRVERTTSTDDGGRLEVDVFVVDSFVTTTAFADWRVECLARRIVLRVIRFVWRAFGDAWVDGSVDCRCLIYLALSVRVVGSGEGARFIRWIVTGGTIPRGIKEGWPRVLLHDLLHFLRELILCIKTKFCTIYR